MQGQFLEIFNAGSGKLSTPQMQRSYLNFYGNLMKSSDDYLVNVLDTLEATGLLENTLIIRTSDHGEMGLAHGGLRQKNFNVYEESQRVPLVYSSPRLFPRPRATSALVSHPSSGTTSPPAAPSARHCNNANTPGSNASSTTSSAPACSRWRAHPAERRR